MTVRKLIESKFIPSDFAAKMDKTLPGALADFLDRLLYGAQEDGDRLKIGRKEFVHRSNKDSSYIRYAGLDEKGDYADTVRTLREIRDYLEGCALKELLEK